MTTLVFVFFRGKTASFYRYKITNESYNVNNAVTFWKIYLFTSLCSVFPNYIAKVYTKI